MEPNQRLTALFRLYRDKNISQEEFAEWMRLVRDPQMEIALKELILQETLLIDSKNQLIDKEMTDERAAEIFKQIISTPEKAKVVHTKKWWTVAAAASVIVIILGGSYFAFYHKTENEIVKTQGSTADIKAPEKSRATITLSTGKTIFLDSAANGELASEASVAVIKKADGNIEYNGNIQPKITKTLYNTLSNPRGSKVITLTLADGTQVWLNAESSIRYPVSFGPKERKAEITGEAYFEVARDKTKPFTVSNGNTQVQVLGTHFNINAYQDEKDIKVTLLEGSVKVSTDNSTKIIRPGEQAIVTSAIEIENKTDIVKVMAWKNGMFRFSNTNIEEIMRQAARWYDVEISYQGDFSDLNFGGSVSRKANISELLKRLAATETFHYTIEGNKICLIK